jgi:hypothetical protein
MIAGTSLKKLEASTVFTVADHVIWYPTKWQMRAEDICMLIPVKKIEKKTGELSVFCHLREDTTHGYTSTDSPKRLPFPGL